MKELGNEAIRNHNEEEIENDAHNLATILGFIDAIIVNIELKNIKTFDDFCSVQKQDESIYKEISNNTNRLYETLNQGIFRSIKQISFKKSERTISAHELLITINDNNEQKDAEKLWQYLESLIITDHALYSIEHKNGIKVKFNYDKQENLNDSINSDNNFKDIKYILEYLFKKFCCPRNNKFDKKNILYDALNKLNNKQSKKILQNYHKTENIKHNKIQDLILALAYNNDNEVDIKNCLKNKFGQEYNDEIINCYINILLKSNKIENSNNIFYPVNKELCEAAFIENIEDIKLNQKQNQIQGLILALAFNNADESDIKNCLKIKCGQEYKDEIINSHINILLKSSKIENFNNIFYPKDKELCESAFIENEEIITKYYFGDENDIK